MVTPKRRYPKEEFVRRGDAIYAKDIEPHLKPKDKGKYVAIDIETGDYEIAGEDRTASNNLRARLEDPRIYMMKVGSPYLAHFGGHSPTRKT